jgi:hypothetical protein
VECLKLPLVCLINKNVSIADVECVEQFVISKKFLEMLQNNQEFCNLIAHKNLVKYFENSKNVDSKLELLKMSQLFFAIPSHNVKAELLFSLMQCSGQRREAV